MSKEAYFNDLPAKPVYIDRVKRVLASGALGQTALVTKTGLTKTQALCAVDALVADGKLQIIESTPKKYKLIS